MVPSYVGPVSISSYVENGMRMALPNDSTLRGYVADFGTPYFISEQDKKIATPYASLSVTGWHLLNGVLQEDWTRADLKEATAIRHVYRE